MGDRLESRLGYRFKDPGLLTAALTHASVAKSTPKGGPISNERLEFLGDRVLGLAVADLLYARFPDEEEGALARRLAALVSGETLARVAADCGLGEHVAMSAAERDGGGTANPGLLADACEAVIAALYLDGGLEAARAFVVRHWTALMEADPTPPREPKTALQEWLQGRGQPLPVYRVAEQSGPAHAPRFVVEVTAGDLGSAEGEGRSKRAAEREAAARLLETLESGG